MSKQTRKRRKYYYYSEGKASLWLQKQHVPGRLRGRSSILHGTNWPGLRNYGLLASRFSHAWINSSIVQTQTANAPWTRASSKNCCWAQVSLLGRRLHSTEIPRPSGGGP